MAGKTRADSGIVVEVVQLGVVLLQMLVERLAVVVAAQGNLALKWRCTDLASVVVDKDTDNCPC